MLKWDFPWNKVFSLLPKAAKKQPKTNKKFQPALTQAYHILPTQEFALLFCQRKRTKKFTRFQAGKTYKGNPIGQKSGWKNVAPNLESLTFATWRWMSRFHECLIVGGFSSKFQNEKLIGISEDVWTISSEGMVTLYEPPDIFTTDKVDEW